MNCIKELLNMMQSVGMTDACEKVKSQLANCENVFANISNDVNDKILDWISQNQYDNVKKAADIPAQAEICKNYMRNLLNDEYVQEPVVAPATASIAPELFDESQLEKHPLDHNNDFTTPYFFEINGKRYDLPKHKWTTFFEILCDVLYQMNSDKFKSFVQSVSAENLSYCRFSQIPEKKYHRIYNSEIYVCFKGNALSVRRYAQALLQTYGLDNKTVVYWLPKKPSPGNSTEIEIGSHVRHDSFGEGVVRDIENTAPDHSIVKVKFANQNEEKKFLLDERRQNPHLTLLG